MTHKAKQGLVLPLVLAFMVVSQIVYLGICQLNSLYRSRIQQATAHYQVKIQDLLFQQILRSLLEQDWLQQVASQIEDDLRLFERQITSQKNWQLVDASFLTNDSSSVAIIPLKSQADLSDPTSQTAYLVYALELEFSDLNFSRPSLSEKFLAQLQKSLADLNLTQLASALPTGQTARERVSLLGQELLDQGYLLESTHQESLEGSWQVQLDVPYQVDFNTGKSQLSIENDQLGYYSQLNDGHAYQTKIDLPSLTYQINFCGQVYIPY